MSKHYLFILFSLLILPFDSANAALATKARICAVKGTVYISPASQDNSTTQQDKCPLNQSLDKTECRVVNQATRIETGSDGYAIVEYANGASVKIAPNSIVILRRKSLYVKSGNSWFKVDKKASGEFVVNTPTAIAGIRGTEFIVNVSDNGETNIQLIEGKIEVSDIDEQSTLGLSAGIQVFIPGESTDFDTSLLEFDEDDMWWTDWPTLVPLNGGHPNNNDNDGEDNNQLFPVADSHVYEYSYRNWNKCNWGKYNVLGVGWNPTGGEKRTYIKFDLSNINANSFDKAYLRLYHNHTSGKNSNFSLGIHVVREAWNEGSDTYHSGQNEQTASLGEISWAQQPHYDFDPVAQFTPGLNANKYIEIDITPMVKAWLTGKANNGLMIKSLGMLSGRSSETQYGFYAREYSESDKRPTLILD